MTRQMAPGEPVSVLVQRCDTHSRCVSLQTRLLHRLEGLPVWLPPPTPPALCLPGEEALNSA